MSRKFAIASSLVFDKTGTLTQGVFKVAKKTRQIVVQNIVLAMGIKGLFIGLGVIGIATLWEAVFADVGVALLAIFNATRVLKS